MPYRTPAPADDDKTDRLDDADLVMRDRVCGLRLKGYTVQKIATLCGVSVGTVHNWVAKWLPEALGLHPDAQKAVIDMAGARYEELYRKVWPLVEGVRTGADGDGDGAEAKAWKKEYRDTVLLVASLIDRQVALVASGGQRGGRLQADAPDDDEAVLEEARRLGIE